jgi:hypothetical protein
LVKGHRECSISSRPGPPRAAPPGGRPGRKPAIRAS